MGSLSTLGGQLVGNMQIPEPSLQTDAAGEGCSMTSGSFTSTPKRFDTRLETPAFFKEPGF